MHGHGAALGVAALKLRSRPGHAATILNQGMNETMISKITEARSRYDH